MQQKTLGDYEDSGLDCPQCDGTYKGKIGLGTHYAKAHADSEYKLCIECLGELPKTIEYFHKHSENSSGFRSRCKECRGCEYGLSSGAINKRIGDGLRYCSGCEKIYPEDVEHFVRSKNCESGFKGRCKECRGEGFGVQHPNKVYDSPDGEKYCTACHEVFPETTQYFYRHCGRKSGFADKCKECLGDEFGVEQVNRVYDFGDSQMCTTCKRILPKTESNFAKRLRGGDWHFRSSCKDCNIDYLHEWMDDNSDKVWESRQLRRRKELQGKVNFTEDDWIRCQQHWSTNEGNVECAYCGTVPDVVEQDHYHPLSQGGDTVAWNIVPACRSCNARKNAYDPVEWYPIQEFYSTKRHSKIEKYLSNTRDLKCE